MKGAQNAGHYRIRGDGPNPKKTDTKIPGFSSILAHQRQCGTPSNTRTRRGAVCGFSMATLKPAKHGRRNTTLSAPSADHAAGLRYRY